MATRVIPCRTLDDLQAIHRRLLQGRVAGLSDNVLILCPSAEIARELSRRALVPNQPGAIDIDGDNASLD